MKPVRVLVSPKDFRHCTRDDWPTFTVEVLGTSIRSRGKFKFPKQSRLPKGTKVLWIQKLLSDAGHIGPCLLGSLVHTSTVAQTLEKTILVAEPGQEFEVFL